MSWLFVETFANGLLIDSLALGIQFEVGTTKKGANNLVKFIGWIAEQRQTACVQKVLSFVKNILSAHFAR